MSAELSAAGERYVKEEIKQALLWVMKVKEMMGIKEKHRCLMDTLRHNRDKKRVREMKIYCSQDEWTAADNMLLRSLQNKSLGSKQHPVSFLAY